MNDSIDFHLVTENIAKTLEPQLRFQADISPSWNFIVVFVSLLLLVINKHMFTQRFKTMFDISYKKSDVDKMTREWNPIASFTGFSVVVVYIAVVSLIIQKLVLVLSGNTILYSSFGFYLDVCTFVSAYLIIQYLVVTLYGWLFGIEAAASHHEVTHLSTMMSLDVMLTLLSLIILFYPTKIILTVAVAIILIITAIRIVKIFFELQILSKLNSLNIFLYLCTLEIIPISIAITMVCRLILTNCVL